MDKLYNISRSLHTRYPLVLSHSPPHKLNYNYLYRKFDLANIMVFLPMHKTMGFVHVVFFLVVFRYAS